MMTERAEPIRALLITGTGIRETARKTGAGASSVQRIRASMMLVQSQDVEAAA